MSSPTSITAPLPFDVLENQWKTLTVSDLLAGITDPENDPLTISNLTASAGTILNQSNGDYSYIPPVDFFGQITFTYDVSDGQNPPSQQTRTVEVLNQRFPAISTIPTGDVEPGYNYEDGVRDLIKVYWDYDANGNVIGSARTFSDLKRFTPGILANDLDTFTSFPMDRIAVKAVTASNNPNGISWNGYYYAVGDGDDGVAWLPTGSLATVLRNIASIRPDPYQYLDRALNVFTGMEVDTAGRVAGFVNLRNPELTFALEQGKPITESYVYLVEHLTPNEGHPSYGVRVNTSRGLEDFTIYQYYNYVTLSLERNAPPVVTPKSLSFQEDEGDFFPEFQSTFAVRGGGL